jgi:hypothetical protein
MLADTGQARSVTGPAWSGLDQVNHDVDVAAYSFGIWTRLVRGVRQGLGDFALKTRRANVEASL